MEYPEDIEHEGFEQYWEEMMNSDIEDDTTDEK